MRETMYDNTATFFTYLFFSIAQMELSTAVEIRLKLQTEQ